MAKPRKKLTREQWDELNQQFERTPGLSESAFASGEHYLLVAILNKFGYYPHSRNEALELAEELLAQGWEDEQA